MLSHRALSSCCASSSPASGCEMVAKVSPSEHSVGKKPFSMESVPSVNSAVPSTTTK